MGRWRASYGYPRNSGRTIHCRGTPRSGRSPWISSEEVRQLQLEPNPDDKRGDDQDRQRPWHTLMAEHFGPRAERFRSERLKKESAKNSINRKNSSI